MIGYIRADAALALIEAPENQPVFSAASLWEIVIKANLGREGFVVEPKLIRRGLLDNDDEELPVNSAVLTT